MFSLMQWSRLMILWTLTTHNKSKHHLSQKLKNMKQEMLFLSWLSRSTPLIQQDQAW